MRTIERRLEEEKAGREVRGARLQGSLVPTVALVGYTNAGKTTILNALSGESRSTADRLFETLATTTRVVQGFRKTTGTDTRNGATEGTASAAGAESLSEPDFVLTDTVGFIRKLPTHLVHSFASTLESAAAADVVVLCADAGSQELDEEIRIVRETMDVPEDILCLNKSDLLDTSTIGRLEIRYPDAVIMSAVRDASPLLDAIHRALARGRVRVQLLIPHSNHRVSAALYGQTEIHERRDTEDGVELDITMPNELLARYAQFRVT